MRFICSIFRMTVQMKINLKENLNVKKKKMKNMVKIPVIESDVF